MTVVTAIAPRAKPLGIKNMATEDRYDDLGEQLIDQGRDIVGIDKRLSIHEELCKQDRERRAQDMAELKSMYLGVSRDQAALQAAMQANQVAMQAAITASTAATQSHMTTNQTAMDTRLAAIELKLAAGSGAGRASREIVAWILTVASLIIAAVAASGHVHIG
jgi:hypothetical protein